MPMQRHRPRSFSGTFILLTLALGVAAVGITGCGASGDGEIRTNAFGAGADRAFFFEGRSLPVFEDFLEVEVEGTTTGFIGAPLFLSTRLAAVVSADHHLLLLRNMAVYDSILFDDDVFLTPELAADADGRVFAATTDGRLVAVDTGGQVLWIADETQRHPDSIALPTWPLVVPSTNDNDQELILSGTTDGRTAAYDAEGKLLWQKSFARRLIRSVCATTDGGIIIGLTSNDYTRADELVRLDKRGEEIWRSTVQGRIESGPILVQDRVIVGLAAKGEERGYRTGVASIDVKSSKEIWYERLGAIPIALAGDGEGNIYAAGGGGSRVYGGHIVALDRNGSTRWDMGFERNGPSVIVVTDNRVCFVARDDETLGLFTYTREGGFIKFAPVRSTARISSFPVVTPYGTIILAAADRPLFLQNTGGGLFQ